MNITYEHVHALWFSRYLREGIPSGLADLLFTPVAHRTTALPHTTQAAGPVAHHFPYHPYLYFIPLMWDFMELLLSCLTVAPFKEKAEEM